MEPPQGAPLRRTWARLNGTYGLSIVAVYSLDDPNDTAHGN
jgi:hypothetical protein